MTDASKSLAVTDPRVTALGLSGIEVAAIQQLQEMPGGVDAETSLAILEKGNLSLSRVAMAASMRADSYFESFDIEALGDLITMVGFDHSDIVHGLDLDPSRVVLGGRQYNIEEYEQLMLKKLSGKGDLPAAASSAVNAPHEAILQSLIEGVLPVCGEMDAAVFLVSAINEHFEGDALRAFLYQTKVSPEEFGSTMLVGVDPDTLGDMFEHLTPGDKDDFLHRIGDMGITPASLGLFHLEERDEPEGFDLDALEEGDVSLEEITEKTEGGE